MARGGFGRSGLSPFGNGALGFAQYDIGPTGGAAGTGIVAELKALGFTDAQIANILAQANGGGGSQGGGAAGGGGSQGGGTAGGGVSAADVFQPTGQPGLYDYGGAGPVLWQPGDGGVQAAIDRAAASGHPLSQDQIDQMRAAATENPSFNPNLKIYDAPAGKSFYDAVKAVLASGAGPGDVMRFTNTGSGKPELFALNPASTAQYQRNDVAAAALDKKVLQQTLQSISMLNGLLADPNFTAQPKSDIQAQLDLQKTYWAAHPEQLGQAEVLNALGAGGGEGAASKQDTSFVQTNQKYANNILGASAKGALTQAQIDSLRAAVTKATQATNPGFVVPTDPTAQAAFNAANQKYVANLTAAAKKGALTQAQQKSLASAMAKLAAVGG